MKIKTENIPGYPCHGHRCEVVPSQRLGEDKPYQFEVIHYDTTGQAISSVLVKTKTDSKEALTRIWSEWNNQQGTAHD